MVVDKSKPLFRSLGPHNEEIILSALSMIFITECFQILRRRHLPDRKVMPDLCTWPRRRPRPRPISCIKRLSDHLRMFLRHYFWEISWNICRIAFNFRLTYPWCTNLSRTLAMFSLGIRLSLLVPVKLEWMSKLWAFLQTMIRRY